MERCSCRISYRGIVILDDSCHCYYLRRQPCKSSKSKEVIILPSSYPVALVAFALASTEGFSRQFPCPSLLDPNGQNGTLVPSKDPFHWPPLLKLNVGQFWDPWPFFHPSASNILQSTSLVDAVVFDLDWSHAIALSPCSRQLRDRGQRAGSPH